jgi:hypothetical protein
MIFLPVLGNAALFPQADFLLTCADVPVVYRFDPLEILQRGANNVSQTLSFVFRPNSDYRVDGYTSASTSPRCGTVVCFNNRR